MFEELRDFGDLRAKAKDCAGVLATAHRDTRGDPRSRLNVLATHGKLQHEAPPQSPKR